MLASDSLYFCDIRHFMYDYGRVYQYDKTDIFLMYM